MIKNDKWIREQAASGMITPFLPELVRNHQEGYPMISAGTSSYGYDIRLSPKEFLIFQHIPGTVVNPKRFNPANLVSVDLHQDADGQFFILPAHSYGLGVAVEHLQVPANILVLATGKSTYARCGIISCVTPAEPGWRGHLTLEFSNSSDADCRMYVNEGVIQLLFLEGEPCEVNYESRSGKYQQQPEQVVLAKA